MLYNHHWAVAVHGPCFIIWQPWEKSGKTNQELVGLLVIPYLLRLLQPEGDTSLELPNKKVKDHPFTPSHMQCGNQICRGGGYKYG